MRNSIAHGLQVAVRTVLLQLATTLVVALGALAFGPRIGLAVAAGGAIVALGNLFFALRLFGRGVQPARQALRSAWSGQALKWLWLVVMLYLAITRWDLPGTGLIAGVLAAQFASWIALIAVR